MLYSRTTEDRKIDFFASMLEHSLNGEEGYRHYIDPVIMDAHKLSVGEKDYYTIDRENYPVTVYLVDQEQNYFADLDTNSLGRNDYQHIMKMLVKQPEYAFA